MRTIGASTSDAAERHVLALRVVHVLFDRVVPRLIEDARVTLDAETRWRRYSFAHDALAEFIDNGLVSGDAQIASCAARWAPVLEGLKLATGAAQG